MAWRRPGDKTSSEPIMVSTLTHICFTRPQRVNPFRAKCFITKTKMYLYFIQLLHSDTTKVVEILPRVRQARAYFTQSISWASYQIRKIKGYACAGNARNVFPPAEIQRKPWVSDPGMHHGTCVTHVPWCMSGLLTRGGGENVRSIPGACAPASLRIWQEVHGWCCQSAIISRKVVEIVPRVRQERAYPS